MTNDELIDLVWDKKPLEDFKKIFKQYKDSLDWGDLLYICKCEKEYASVGGDEGYLENSPICYEYIEYLQSIIDFLEDKGIKVS